MIDRHGNAGAAAPPDMTSRRRLLWAGMITLVYALVIGGSSWWVADLPLVLVAGCVLAVASVLLHAAATAHHTPWPLLHQRVWVGILSALLLLVLVQPGGIAVVLLVIPLIGMLALTQLAADLVRWLIIAASGVILALAVLRALVLPPPPTWSTLVSLLRASAVGVVVTDGLLLHLLGQHWQRVARTSYTVDRRAMAGLQRAGDGLWDWDMLTNQVLLSASWHAMLGETAEATRGTPDDWFRRVHPADLPALQHTLLEHLAGRFPQFSSEHRLQHQDGSYRWVWSRGQIIRDESGAALRMAGLQTDITTWKAREATLVQRATHDPRSGLPNRDQFLDELRRSVEAERRVLVVLGMTDYVQLFALLGPQGEAELLRVVGQRLQAALRPGDHLAQIGAATFGIVLGLRSTVAEAATVAERLKRTLTTHFEVAGQPIALTVDCQQVPLDASGTDAEKVLNQTEQQVMRRLSATHSVFVPMAALAPIPVTSVPALTTSLVSAIQHDDLTVQYQPIVQLDTSEVVGLIAHASWTHPTVGSLTPAILNLLVESTGQQDRFTAWLLRTACAHLLTLPHLDGQPPRFVCVPVPAEQLTKPSFVEALWSALAVSRLAPTQLQLVIPAGTMLVMPGAVNLLDQLRALGIGLVLGSTSTVANLQHALMSIPLTGVSLAASVTQTIGHATEGEREVTALLTMATAAGLTCSAEGISTTAEWDYLQQHGCHYGVQPVQLLRAMLAIER